MVTIPELKEKYEGLDMQLPAKSEETIDPDCLLTFEYEYPERDTEVVIDTDEFTAVCPWTGLPDTGDLVISATFPSSSCIELKSLKYYLLSYRDVGIVQEHAANRILNDLVELLSPPPHENYAGLQDSRRTAYGGLSGARRSSRRWLHAAATAPSARGCRAGPPAAPPSPLTSRERAFFAQQRLR